MDVERWALGVGRLLVPSTQQILGVGFWNETVEEAVQAICERGGLLVVPAAPALVNIQYDEEYRRALIEADVVIADSGFMVLLWKVLQRRTVPRISGLAYLKLLLEREELRQPGQTLFVLPTASSRERALTWLRDRDFQIEPNDCYIAPKHGKTEVRGKGFATANPSLGESEISDESLLSIANERRPAHIIIGLGGGVQEKLGLYLRDTLGYRPAIHCIGAALGFLTGDQKPIPNWADPFLSWLVASPRSKPAPLSAPVLGRARITGTDCALRQRAAGAQNEKVGNRK